MAQDQPTRRPLEGSERKPLQGAKSVGKADPTERLEVTVLLRRRNTATLTELIRKLATGETAGIHLGREQFEDPFGADTADIATIRKFADAHGEATRQDPVGMLAQALEAPMGTRSLLCSKRIRLA